MIKRNKKPQTLSPPRGPVTPRWAPSPGGLALAVPGSACRGVTDRGLHKKGSFYTASQRFSLPNDRKE